MMTVCGVSYGDPILTLMPCAAAKGAPEQPKTRYEKLDNRLRMPLDSGCVSHPRTNRTGDLEAILMTEKTATSSSSKCRLVCVVGHASVYLKFPSNPANDNDAMMLDYSSILTDSALASPNGTPGDSPAGGSSTDGGHRSSTAPTSTTTSPQLHPNTQLGVMWSAWPRDLPSLDLLRHL